MSFPALAHAGDIAVTEARVALAPPGARTLAAYMVVANAGAAPRALAGVRAEGFAMAHLHHSMEKDGVAMMAAMDQIEIAPGGSVAFAPGGLHVMLMGPRKALAVGNEVVLTLIFADGAEIAVTAPVERIDAGS
nr:copper chaperone PCu(A)C [Mangrovicoccus sp. HB161399]